MCVGQVICANCFRSGLHGSLIPFAPQTPIGPRCDLCDLATAKLCPSRRKVDPASVANRVQVHLLDESDVEAAAEPEVKVKLEIEGSEGAGVLLATEQELKGAVIKEEDQAGPSRMDW